MGNVEFDLDKIAPHPKPIPDDYGLVWGHMWIPGAQKNGLEWNHFLLIFFQAQRMVQIAKDGFMDDGVAYVFSTNLIEILLGLTPYGEGGNKLIDTIKDLAQHEIFNNMMEGERAADLLKFLPPNK